MRIITGSARGARLTTLEGDATRPTAERVKEGMFSAIQFDLHDRSRSAAAVSYRLKPCHAERKAH